MTEKKSLCISYFLLFFGGWVGLHLLYLRRDSQAFIYWCTFGGYFGLGPLRDIYRIPAYVREANNDNNYIASLVQQMQTKDKPPLSITRIVAQILVGNAWSLLWIAAIPNDPFFGGSLTYLKVLAPIAAAYGVWIIGNIGRQCGSLKWCVLGAYMIAPLAVIHSESLHWSCLSSVALFESRGKMWRRGPLPKHPFRKRVLSLSLGWLFFCSLWVSFIYFNAEITYDDGEKAKVKDAIWNFFKSPMFLEFKNNMKKLWEDAKQDGWSTAWNNFINLLDPFGEQHALKVLGLEKGASQEEISSRFKALTKEWHPDRHKTAETKKLAQEKFVEIADAYEKLSVIKRRRKSKSNKSTFEDEL